MRARQLESLRELAAPLRGLRVLYWGGSGRGFPGGDGPAEAEQVLPEVGVSLVWTHAADPAQADKLARPYDLAIVVNTRLATILGAPQELWTAAPLRALWFWDLRPGSVAAPLRGRVDWAFLSYDGPWRDPGGLPYAPEQWRDVLGCRVGYCPQAAPLREPVRGPDGPRVLFVGDVANARYHAGRQALCRALGATVRNHRDRPGRLALEGLLPELYPSARYALSVSPLAPGYTSVRTYSILACGGLMVLRRFPGADRLFRDGQHAVLFDDAQEAIARLTELDSDDAARLRIAESGRALHAERHTVAHRVLSMARQMTGVAEDFSGWL